MSEQREKWKPPDYGKYPVRVCRSLHFCQKCAQSITLGQEYHDGGYGRRAHVKCAPEAPCKTTK